MTEREKQLLKENEELKIRLAEESELEEANRQLKEEGEALLHSLELLKEAQRISNVGSWEYDLLSGKVIWSDNVYRIFNQNAATYASSLENLYQLIHPEDKERVQTIISRAIHDCSPYTSEYRVVLPDGEIRYIQSKARIINDKTGIPVLLVGITQDITERKKREEELCKSEERFRTSVESFSDGFAILSAVRNKTGKIVDFRYEYINEAGAGLKLYQRPRTEHIGKTILEQVPSFGGTKLFEDYIRIIEEGGTIEKESITYYDIYGINDQMNRVFDLRATKLGDGFVVVWRDITERKQAEESLQRAHQKLQTVLNSITDGFLVLDKNWCITFFSEHGAQMIGMRTEQLIGGCIWDVFPYAKDNLFYESYHRAVASGQTVHFEEYYPEPLNKWFECNCYPSEEGLSVYFQDITERRKMEETIRERERESALMARILELSSQPFGVGLLDGRLGYVNKQFEILTGYTAEELNNQSWNRILTPPEYHEMEQNKLEELIKTGKPVRYEKEYIRKDGTRVPIELLVHVMKDSKGQPEYFYSFLTDITERRKNEHNLNQLIRTLRAMQKSSLLMAQAMDEQKFLEDVCRIIVEDCGHKMVWIGYKQKDPEKSVKPVAHAGFEENYLETLKITWADTVRGRGPTGTAIRTGKPALCRNMQTEPAFEPWRAEALKRGYSSSIVLPLLMDEEAFGAMNIYSEEPDPFSDDEQQLLSKLAHDLAYGIKAIRLNLELRRAKEDLEVKVEERTSLLKKTLNDLDAEKLRFQDVLNMIPAYVALITADYRIPFSNKIFKEYFGDIHDKKCYDHLFGKTEICENCKVKEVFETTQPRFWEWLGPNGRFYQISDFPFTDNDGALFILEMGVDITERKNMEKIVLSKIFETEEKDRRQFASDLHDDLGPTLSAIKLQLKLLTTVKAENERNKLLQICDQLLSESIEKMRILANNIMPNLLKNFGLESAVQSFIDKMGKTCKLHFNFQSNLEDYRFDEDTELHLYRIVTELVNNTIKHSEATDVSLDLNISDKDLKMVYSDNGIGYSIDDTPSRTSGIGLQNIRNRINLLHGTVDFTRRKGKTVVMISKPLPDKILSEPLS